MLDVRDDFSHPGKTTQQGLVAIFVGSISVQPLSLIPELCWLIRLLPSGSPAFLQCHCSIWNAHLDGC
jgi:hypothetical protein